MQKMLVAERRAKTAESFKHVVDAKNKNTGETHDHESCGAFRALNGLQLVKEIEKLQEIQAAAHYLFAENTKRFTIAPPTPILDALNSSCCW